MAKKLLIAEKPSVAKEFAKVLNTNAMTKNGYMESDEYIFTWCVGHLVTMSYPEKYDENLKKWSLDTLPFMPKEYKYEVIGAASKQYHIVCDLLNRDDVDLIYVCTDSGREGEYIYRLVDQMAGCPNKEKRRVWIDSQTEEAIRAGISDAKLLSEYDNLSDSAYLRAKEDYLIGINFSRVLTLKYSYELAKVLNQDRAPIAVGRVMTCVLGMVVDREREIKNFTKVKFYKVNAEIEKEGSKIVAEWKSQEGSEYFESPKLYNETGFKDTAVATMFINKLKDSGEKMKVDAITKKNQKENANLLFNLAELQGECTKRFKISPDRTLEIAQSLYEKKMTTYPRTDARVLSTSVAKEIGKNLNGLFKNNRDEKIKLLLEKMKNEKYSTNIVKSKYVNDAKITDHYAIIPTGFGFENYDKLDDLEKKVFSMIIRRFIAIFFPPAEYSKMNVNFKIAGELFQVSGKVCLNPGYLEAIKEDNKETKEDTKEDGDSEKGVNIEILKTLKKGDELDLIAMNLKEGETSPPSRFTSGSIILAMENAGKLIEDEALREQIKGSGIGTSATRAEIIKKLGKINYIKTNTKTQVLSPSDKGEAIYDIIRKSMPDTLNPQLTASWEKGLGLVASGEIKKEDFMNKLESYVETKVAKFKQRPKFVYGSADYR